MEVEDTTFYACPCCGYRSFATQPPGSYIVCPICVWEDLPLNQYHPTSYCIALRRAQQTFLAIGVSDPQYHELARPPEPHEQRAAGWRPIDELVESIVVQISAAFAGVQRGDGVSIHEADVIDGYGSDEQRAAARLRDSERHWSEVPEATIEWHASALTFLDDRGFHYYLPAYLCWTLRHYTTAAATSNSPESLLWELAVRPWDDDSSDTERTLARFRLLSEAQAQSVCRALRFLVAYAHPCVDTKRAQRALDQYWGRFETSSEI